MAGCLAKANAFIATGTALDAVCFQFRLAIVYGYAGLFKINTDWLIHALPLKIWISANDQLPVVGWIFQQKITPWMFSWAGMLYDLTIVGWLCWTRTRVWAYGTVIVFHTLTGWGIPFDDGGRDTPLFLRAMARKFAKSL